MKTDNTSKIISFLVIFSGLFSPVFSQNNFKDVTTREVFVNYPDSLLKINILSKTKLKKVLPDRLYYWYGTDILAFNRGGYSGNLLHGKYLQFDKKKHLRAEGNFKFGLKNGIWKLWNDKGELISSVNWKNGVKDGEAMFYDQNGNIQSKANYKKDLPDGWIIRYKGKSKEKIRYKNGVEIKPRVKKVKPKPVIQRKDTPKPEVVTNDSTAKKNNFFSKIFSSKKSGKLNEGLIPEQKRNSKGSNTKSDTTKIKELPKTKIKEESKAKSEEHNPEP